MQIAYPQTEKTADKVAGEFMPLLEVRNICISFGGLVAADHVSFSLEAGEIRGLIGPNGAGKSTVLNLISGIYMCDSGSVFINGKDATRLPAYTRARMGLARTFQTPRFLGRSGVRDNMLLGTDLADQMGYRNSFLGKKGYDFSEEISKYLEIANLEFDWDAEITALPYGQQKRLEIVRALLSHPKIILIDEPAAGLNEKELEYSVRLIRHAADKGVGIVLIEHKMDMIMNVCDKIVVLNFGKVIADGSPGEVSSNQQVIEAYLGRKSYA
jgi:ABC-type branched-subunit amino acid transport system ATPase component